MQWCICRSFFQSVCVLGYCLLPTTIALIICRIILVSEQTNLLFFLRLFVSLCGFVWATYGKMSMNTYPLNCLINDLEIYKKLLYFSRIEKKVKLFFIYVSIATKFDLLFFKQLNVFCTLKASIFISFWNRREFKNEFKKSWKHDWFKLSLYFSRISYSSSSYTDHWVVVFEKYQQILSSYKALAVQHSKMFQT